MDIVLPGTPPKRHLPSDEPVTRVLMNPPFALSGSTDKEHLFVSHALSLMADGRILFSLLPLKSLFGANDEKVWRRDELLKKHTLLAVLTFPAELFYPAALKQVAAIIVKKGKPHPKKQNVFWARIAHDGHIVSKKKRLRASEFDPPRDEPDDLPVVLQPLQRFISHPESAQGNCPLFYKTAPINFQDPLLELLPEAYLDNEEPTPEELQLSIDDLVRETVAFLIRSRHEPLADRYDDNR